jgi:hypothetical protein
MAISKFKATCLATLERVRRTGRPLRVTRFGKRGRGQNSEVVGQALRYFGPAPLAIAACRPLVSSNVYV